jgi:nitrite reductase/ring-hydroxylating ferredoxin subunit
VGDWTSLGPVAGRAELDAVVLDGLEIAVARLHDGSWVAFDNVCTHEGCPLADGDLDGTRIICYCHSSTFDVCTGEVLEGPADEPLRVFETRVERGELELRLG